MTTPSRMLCVSHESALFYWRTNPPWYILEGSARNIRSLRGSPGNVKDFGGFHLPEVEFGPEPIDVLVPGKTPFYPQGFRAHEQRAKLPPHALYPLYDGIYVVSPELCLVQLCTTMTFPEILLIGMEFCGTYALRANEFGETGMAQRDYTLTNAAQLQRRYDAWRGLHGIETARKASRHLADNSASPMESALYLLLCLPQKYGGYHLPKPELNPVIPLDSEAQMILRQGSVKPDMLWRERKLIVEYDGEYHDAADQSLHDEMRRAVLATMGYSVHVIKKRQIYDPLAFDGAATAIAKRLGKRLRPLTLGQQYARDDLRAALLKRGETTTGGVQ